MEQQLILDRYRPLEALGQGGSGTVVLAWDTRMQRRVAIKRMPLPVDRFGRPLRNPPGLAEARTAAMLNHPSIVTVFDFETDADEAFLIMEYVDGASLQDVLDDLGQALDLDEAAAVFEAVADALDHAHENGVLHLDIKPANVLVSRDGRVKVTDFGMAALSSASGHGAGAGGTIGYMPLEQLKGFRLAETTDEWAFAALIYECLTAENPFDAATIEAAVVRLETLDPPTPTRFVPSLPRAIDDVLLAGLGLHPDDRYPSVAAFADALEPYLGEPSLGRDSLAGLVAVFATDEPAEETPGLDKLGLWDRLGGHAGMLLIGVVAAVESGWLAWAGLSMTSIQRIGVLGAAAFIAFAALLAPSLGTGLGLAAFAIGLMVSGAWVLGAAVSIAIALWWWFVARRSAGAAVLPLAAPVLGVVWLAPAMPLLAGFSLAPLEAAASGLVGGLLSVLASAASFGMPPYVRVHPAVFADVSGTIVAAASVRAAFLNPATWVVLAGWGLAAALMSLLSGRATRLWAMAGAVLSAGVLAGAYVLANRVSTILGQHSSWVTKGLIGTLVASLTMVLLVAALGAPVRPEPDHEPDDEPEDQPE